MGLGRLKADPLGYVEKVPEKFGQLGRYSGLYFGCSGCARGTMFEQAELVRRYGTEGRVAALAKRLACKFCKQHRRRTPSVYVEVTKPHRSKSEQARSTMGQADALVFDIGLLKPRGTIE